MLRLRKQPHGRFSYISAVAIFVAAYVAYGLWIFGTKPVVPDYAAIIGCLIVYAGLLVIALLVVWRVVRRVRQR